MHSSVSLSLGLCWRFMIFVSLFWACDPNVFYQTQEMSLDLNGCVDGELCQQSLFSQMTLGCYVTQERDERALVRYNRFAVDSTGQLVFDEPLLSQELGDRFVGSLFFLNNESSDCLGLTPNTTCSDGCLLRLQHDEVTVGNERTMIRFSNEMSCDIQSNNEEVLSACSSVTDTDMGGTDMGGTDMGGTDMGGADMNTCPSDLIGAPCSGEQGVGNCALGTYECQSEMLVCVTNQATLESCDTIDNDCDGQIDEDLGGESCILGLGVCETSGAIACVEGNLSCQVQDMPAPSSDDQSCDGIDNDCDGQVDEDYQQISVTCGLGSCAQSGTSFCTNGQEFNDCIALIPGPAEDDLCDGLDSDCDGNIDEAHQISNTQCGLGVCTATGQELCQAGQVVDTCMAGTPAQGEIDNNCDGIDNDCDGNIDEGYQEQATSCGQGVCRSTGRLSCQNGQVVDSCTILAPSNPNDTLCDGQDGDCDGSTDEGYVSSASECGQGVCRAFGELTCVNGVVNDSCVQGSPTRQTDETCNGLDENCNGDVDEDFTPYASPTCGNGLCQQPGQFICQDGNLVDTCTPLEAQTTQDASCDNTDQDCDGNIDEDYATTASSCGIGECTSTGELRCTNGQVIDTCQPISIVGAPDVCDGLDNDCDTRIDEDFTSSEVQCDLNTQCVSTAHSTCINNQLGDTCDAPSNRDSDNDGIADPCAWISAPGLNLDVLRHEVTFGAYRDCVAAGACANDPINYEVVNQTDSRNGCNYISEAQVSNEPETNPLRCLRVDPNVPIEPVVQGQPRPTFEAHQLGEYCSWIGGRLATEAELLAILQAFAPLNCSNSNLGTCPNASNLPQSVCSLEQNPNDLDICDLGGNVWEISSEYSVSGSTRRIYTCFEHFNNSNDNFLNICGQGAETRLGPTLGGRCVR